MDNGFGVATGASASRIDVLAGAPWVRPFPNSGDSARQGLRLECNKLCGGSRCWKGELEHRCAQRETVPDHTTNFDAKSVHGVRETTRFASHERLVERHGHERRTLAIVEQSAHCANALREREQVGAQ